MRRLFDWTVQTPARAALGGLAVIAVIGAIGTWLDDKHCRLLGAFGIAGAYYGWFAATVAVASWADRVMKDKAVGMFLGWVLVLSGVAVWLTGATWSADALGRAGGCVLH